MWCFSANSSETFSTVRFIASASPSRVGRRRSSSTETGFDAIGQALLHLADAQGQQQQGDQLGGEGLGRGHADFRAGLGQQGQVGFAHQRTGGNVADRHAGEEAQLLGVAQGSQGVGGLTGLGDGDEQAIRLHRDLAVAELAGDLHLAGNPGQAFQPVTGDHAGVVAGTAGDDLHVANLGEQLRRLRAEAFHHYLVLPEAAFQGALHDAGLLVDFLEHEVPVLALVGGFGAFVVLHGLALHVVALDIPQAHAVATDLGDIAFFQVDEAVGHLAQRQLVGSEEVLAKPEADHQRAAAAGGDDAVRLRRADHCQAIGPVQFLDRVLQRQGQVADGLQLVMQQVDDDLGVGLRGEHVAQALEPLTERFVVLDDAVVHHRQFVAGEMRVGVAFGWRAVGRPAGMGDAQAAEQRRTGQAFLQAGDLADPAAALQPAFVIEDRHAGAVVAAILEALEAFDEDGGDVALGDRAYDSTHGVFLLSGLDRGADQRDAPGGYLFARGRFQALVGNQGMDAAPGQFLVGNAPTDLVGLGHDDHLAGDLGHHPAQAQQFVERGRPAFEIEAVGTDE